MCVSVYNIYIHFSVYFPINISVVFIINCVWFCSIFYLFIGLHTDVKSFIDLLLNSIPQFHFTCFVDNEMLSCFPCSDENSPSSTKGHEIGEDANEEEEFDWYIEQEPPTAVNDAILQQYCYGFANKRSGVFQNLAVSLFLYFIRGFFHSFSISLLNVGDCVCTLQNGTLHQHLSKSVNLSEYCTFCFK